MSDKVLIRNEAVGKFFRKESRGMTNRRDQAFLYERDEAERIIGGSSLLVIVDITPEEAEKARNYEIARISER